MEKKLVLGVIIAVLIVGIAVAWQVSKPALPPADGKALYTYLSTEASYKNWNLWPGKGQLYAGKEPHGAFLTTYVNDAAMGAIEGKKGVMPEGAIIVKENYMPDKTLAAITVMYKVKGYNPEHNDWFWAKYGPSGAIQAEGKAAMCIACHDKEDDNDYIFTGRLK